MPHKLSSLFHKSNLSKKNQERTFSKENLKTSSIEKEMKIKILREIHQALFSLKYIPTRELENVGDIELNKIQMIKILESLHFIKSEEKLRDFETSPTNFEEMLIDSN